MKNWDSILLRFEKAENDNAKLFNLQYEYLTTGSLKAWQDMFQLFYEVCGNVIKNFAAEKKIGLLSKEDFKEKQMIACIYVMRRFKAKKYKYGYKDAPGYYISKNWINAAKMGVIHALNYTTKAEQCFYDDIDDWKSL